jgi:hypothetical protein
MPQRSRTPLLAALLACGLLVAPAPWAQADDKPTDTKPAATKPVDEKPAEAPAKAKLDEKAPPIVMTDTAGRSFELHDCKIGKQDVEGVVRAAAVKFGAPKDAKLDTKIADLKGVKDEDGDLDEAKMKDLAVEAGAYFGLTATDESAAEFKTLGDLVTWITEANSAPILLLTWGPRCPTSRRLNDKIVELIATSKIRAYAIACNYKDTEKHYAQFLDAFEFSLRIFPDRDQKVTDILGGKTTPHFFLFDSKGVLRYRGGLDNDPMGYMEDDERKDHLADAISAIKAGKDVPAKDTAPAG